MNRAPIDDIVAGVIAAAIVCVLLAAMGWLAKARFDECRAHGFSTFYCLGR